MNRLVVCLAVACAHPSSTTSAGRRVVAIGDLHGDVEAARRALRLAGAIDGNDRWIGKDLVVVQTGDLIDRGDTDREVLELFARLADESHGAVIPLDGNHELMNAASDFRYVTPHGMDEFGGEDARRAAVAKFAAARHIFTIVDGTLFVHAGVLPAVAPKLAALDDEARAWAANGGTPPSALTDDEGPLWTRFYAADSPELCATLDAALAATGAHRMVVGHTVQKDGITSACDGRLWRIDVGLASEYGGPTQILEIIQGRPRVLK